MTSFIAHYHQTLKTKGFAADAAQVQAARILQRIEADLWAAQSRGPSRWFHKSKPTLVKGLYLWGGVGRGKTFLMDVFFEHLPFERKLRLHFYRFMERIHAELEQVQGEKDPLKQVAKKIAQETSIVCLDEFMVEDIADAMILALLLDALFVEGVCVVTTSNVIPDKLYEGGLQRDRFLLAIALIKTNLEIFNLDAGVDYREQVQHASQRFFTPLLGERAFMQTHFELLTEGQAVLANAFVLNDRAITAIARADKVLWIEFHELCKSPRGQADYIALANQYKTILISNMPQLTPNMEGYARRFVSAIDEFYDQEVELYLSATMPLDQLYEGNQCKMIFERTYSRLGEMLKIL